MPKYNSYYDEYEQYEIEFDPRRTDRRARRKRKTTANHIPKKQQHEIIEEIADTSGLEAGFETTYEPGLFEEGWLLSSLRTFYDQMIITDVLARIKGGKEASVYRCRAHESTNEMLVAAKVYRPRMFRNLRNDRLYREGREILTAEGKAVKNNDHRRMRAIGKKTAYGQQVSHTSWLMHEYKTLQALHQAGADVPRPVAAGDNAIIMTYHGDDAMAAPVLAGIRPPKDEIHALFRRVMHNVTLMMKHGMVHGDLSAYNILYWQGQITLIDFPQVTPVYTNSSAQLILQRDITRVCEYFQRMGVNCDPQAIADDLWQRYGRPPAEPGDFGLEDF